MPRKVIIDCDMGTDDAVGLCLTLFDSRLEILAVTATEGCVTAEQANHNLQAIIAELDPARYPRLGNAQSTDNAPPVDTRFLYGNDGLGNAGWDAPQPQHSYSSEKLIIDCVRANPEEVTILCLGPLTNLARAFQRDPKLPELVGEIVMVGGSTDGTGNITPCAEFNFYFDPPAARTVLRSRTTKTLIPLNVTRQVTFGFGSMDEFPGDHTRVGFFVRQILPFTFRAYRQKLGMESIVLNDAIGALALLEPQLIETEVVACDVETDGELTRGMLVVDKRPTREWRPNVSVATSIRVDAARQYLLDLLMLAGNQSYS
jgi:inosine-uridine nucleoside N-ribohydrolase